MRLLICSDLHLEFHRDGGRAFVRELSEVKHDVLVLAGDVSNATGIADALALFVDNFKQIVYVAGNHEFYGGSVTTVERELAKFDGRYGNFHWLDESSVTINGQRFIGTSLWFPDDSAAVPHRKMMNDFHLIDGFVPWVFEKSDAACQFLDRELAAADVMVTHHLPSPQCVQPKYLNSPLNAFFVRDLTTTISRVQPKLVIHGHTHESVDFMIGKSRVICNPFGYARSETNSKFNPALVVEVGVNVVEAV